MISLVDGGNIRNVHTKSYDKSAYLNLFCGRYSWSVVIITATALSRRFLERPL